MFSFAARQNLETNMEIAMKGDLTCMNIRLLLILGFCSCQLSMQEKPVGNGQLNTKTGITVNIDSSAKMIHVFVALCDNKYQGIVPVPAKIGNGQDPENNLYWGAGAGIRTWFRKSKKWKLLRKEKRKYPVLERVIFKHATKDYYLVADAYDGKEIVTCTRKFLSSASGNSADTVQVNNKVLGIGGSANLVTYIGHNGLMDFTLPETYTAAGKNKRDVILLACVSKGYFAPMLKNANVNPLVWTTNLMAPEAYTLHDALTGYVNRESNEAIRTRAAKAYAKYQRCSEKAARGLLVTGW